MTRKRQAKNRAPFKGKHPKKIKAPAELKRRSGKPGVVRTPTGWRVQLDLHPQESLDDAIVESQTLDAIGIEKDEIANWSKVRRSIDARRARVRIRLGIEVVARGQISIANHADPVELPRTSGSVQVAIVGAGPAGMFCAWSLAQKGIRSVILERGKPVQPRRFDLALLSREGILNVDSNYCFGEGGAGTFSDGKLYTRSSKRGPVNEILETYIACGAPESIRVESRPHIGTNRLPRIVRTMRERLIEAGVEFRFQTRVDGLERGRSGSPKLRLSNGGSLEVPQVVLATGHSAPDVWHWLIRAGVKLSFKPLAIGVRVEHPQSCIDRIQFGDLAGHPALGAASYRLVDQINDRGVYSFCMCPGGFIVPAATQIGQQVVNGMSPSHRRGRYANSGFVVEIGVSEIEAAGFSENPIMLGVEYLASMERRAYQAGGGGFVAPAQRIGDFLQQTLSSELPPTSYHRGLVSVQLHEVLGSVAEPLRQSLRRWSEKMPEFLHPDAIAVGVETRTSSPVQVDRDPQTMMAITWPNIYPCGEGAGFAGGIVSAALDGRRVGQAIVRSLRQS